MKQDFASSTLESLDRPALEAHQSSRLKQLLASIDGKNPFYTRKFRAAGVSIASIRVPEDLEILPLTAKGELVADQAEHPPFGSNLTEPIGNYTRYCQTSSTTGSPLRWLDTRESWDWMVDNWMRVFQMAQISSQDCVFIAFSFAPFLGFWTAFEASARMGCLSIPGGGLSSSARLRIMQENGATVLCCTPTYAVRLAEVAVEEKLDLSRFRIKTVIVAGEPGGSLPVMRTRIERLWNGAQVRDHHGMTETGPVTYACPKQKDVLHVIESAFFCEVIHPETEQPVTGGEAGELVLTSLGRLGSPLLRYRTGDLVQAVEGQPCECGSYETALQGGIRGRADDVVMIRGVNLYPSAVEELVRSSTRVLEYQVEVQAGTTLPELHLKIEVSPECEDGALVAKHLESSLRNAFALRIPVSVVPGGTLPRSEMKSKRWVRV
jgi:phenylacetate-CoA ligase